MWVVCTPLISQTTLLNRLTSQAPKMLWILAACLYHRKRPRWRSSSSIQRLRLCFRTLQFWTRKATPCTFMVIVSIFWLKGLGTMMPPETEWSLIWWIHNYVTQSLFQLEDGLSLDSKQIIQVHYLTISSLLTLIKIWLRFCDELIIIICFFFAGMWFVHCHVDDHQLWGLNMAFEVESGPTASTSLPPPPADLPKC